MIFPVTIKGKVKLNFPDIDDSIVELFSRFLASSLTKEGAILRESTQGKIDFERPFVLPKLSGVGNL